MKPLEHADVFPAASVAVALKMVVEFAPTVTLRPGDPNTVALPLATAVPEQSEVVYSLTVDPASALPKIVGLALLAGEAGDEPRPVGADGAI